MKKIFSLFLLLILLLNFGSAQNEEQKDTVDIYIFHSPGCPHCANMLKFLGELEEKDPSLNITRYELRENLDLLFSLAEKYNLELTDRIPIPIVFTENRAFVGDSEEIENSIFECIEECKNGGHTVEGDATIKNIDIEGLTIPAVISAAAVDAVNPCAFAVLIILMATVLSSGKRKRALFAGLAFTASIYISYFLIGVGLYSAVSAAGISHVFYTIVAILAILVGLFNLKDYLWYGRWFIMEVPRSWRPRMKQIIKGVTSIPGAFVAGLIVSVFLLPCTSGPYIVILGLLAKVATRNFAIMLLLLYNLIFILPMLLITFGIYFGITTTEKAEIWRTRKLKILHLIAGVIMILLGIGMFVAMGIGWI